MCHCFFNAWNWVRKAVIAVLVNIHHTLWQHSRHYPWLTLVRPRPHDHARSEEQGTRAYKAVMRKLKNYTAGLQWADWLPDFECPRRRSRVQPASWSRACFCKKSLLCSQCKKKKKKKKRHLLAERTPNHFRHKRHYDRIGGFCLFGRVFFFFGGGGGLVLGVGFFFFFFFFFVCVCFVLFFFGTVRVSAVLTLSSPSPSLALARTLKHAPHRTRIPFPPPPPPHTHTYTL